MVVAAARAVAVTRMVALVTVGGGSPSGKGGCGDDSGSSNGSTGGNFGW